MEIFYIVVSGSRVFVMKSGAPADKIRRVVFHSMFETACEDLGVLGVITDVKKWSKKSEVNEVFLGASKQK